MGSVRNKERGKRESEGGMRGIPSSKRYKVGGSTEIDKVDKTKEESHISGAYIRSFVKHLTSTRTKDDDGGSTKGLNNNGEGFSDDHNTQQQSPTQPPQPKKQVKRRFHTNRPYKETLINLAEARKEIVAALKFHRASMKQQARTDNHDRQSSQTHPQLEQSLLKPSLGQERISKSKRNTGVCPFTATSFSYMEPYSGLSCPPSIPYYWPLTTIAPSPLPLQYQENLDSMLPNPTFQDFDTRNTYLYHNSSSTYSTSTVSVAVEGMVGGIPEEAMANSSGGGLGLGGLHHAMDDDEMEEIRSLGEKHQMEWNDTINLVTSVWWFNFLKAMEIGAEEGEATKNKDDGYSPFDQYMEFPPWLINANESSNLQQYFDDQFAEDYLQNLVLPCLDVMEIEGMDGEWMV